MFCGFFNVCHYSIVEKVIDVFRLLKTLITFWEEPHTEQYAMDIKA